MSNRGDKEVIQDGLFGVLPIFLHLFSLPQSPWMPKQSCKSPPRADMPVQQTFKTLFLPVLQNLCTAAQFRELHHGEYSATFPKRVVCFHIGLYISISKKKKQKTFICLYCQAAE